jgi:hypothetical protein
VPGDVLAVHEVPVVPVGAADQRLPLDDVLRQHALAQRLLRLQIHAAFTLFLCAVHFKVAKKHSAAHSEDDLFEGIGDADFSFIEGDDEEEYSVNNNISVDDDYHQTTMEFDENAFIVLKPLHSEEEVFLQPRDVPMDDGLFICDNF